MHVDDVLSLSLAVNKMCKNKANISCFNISIKEKRKGNRLDFRKEQVAARWLGCGGFANRCGFRGELPDAAFTWALTPFLPSHWLIHMIFLEVGSFCLNTV